MGVLSSYFRPKMFSPDDCARYHSRTVGAHVLATVVGPSLSGPQFCHIRYMPPGGHESAQLGFAAWAMCLMGNCTSLVIYVRKSATLRN